MKDIPGSDYKRAKKGSGKILDYKNYAGSRSIRAE